MPLPPTGEITAAIVVARRLRSAVQPRRRDGGTEEEEEEEAVSAALAGERSGLDGRQVWSGEEEAGEKGWAARQSIFACPAELTTKVGEMGDASCLNRTKLACRARQIGNGSVHCFTANKVRTRTTC